MIGIFERHYGGSFLRAKLAAEPARFQGLRNVAFGHLGVRVTILYGYAGNVLWCHADQGSPCNAWIEMDQAAYNNVHHNVTLFFSRYPHIRAEPDDDDDVASAPQPAADLEPDVAEPSATQDTVSPASPTSSEVPSAAASPGPAAAASPVSPAAPVAASPVPHAPEFFIGSPAVTDDAEDDDAADDEYMPAIVAEPPPASAQAGTAPASAGTAPATAPGIIPPSQMYETFQGNPAT